MRRFLRVLMSSAAACALFASCGGDGTAVQHKVEAIESRELLPATVLDLNVAPEAVKEKLKAPGATYAQSLGLYSFRKGELLQATLQVTRLRDDARVDESDFRNRVVRGIATGEITQMKMGQKMVWLSQSLRQNVAIWFDGHKMFVLSAREEFDRPRTLLRQLLEMKVDV